MLGIVQQPELPLKAGGVGDRLSQRGDRLLVFGAGATQLDSDLYELLGHRRSSLINRSRSPSSTRASSPKSNCRPTTAASASIRLASSLSCTTRRRTVSFNLCGIR